jgi:hypothetical protein
MQATLLFSLLLLSVPPTPQQSTLISFFLPLLPSPSHLLDLFPAGCQRIAQRVGTWGRRRTGAGCRRRAGTTPLEVGEGTTPQVASGRQDFFFFFHDFVTNWVVNSIEFMCRDELFCGLFTSQIYLCSTSCVVYDDEMSLCVSGMNWFEYTMNVISWNCEVCSWFGRLLDLSSSSMMKRVRMEDRV